MLTSCNPTSKEIAAFFFNTIGCGFSTFFFFFFSLGILSKLANLTSVVAVELFFLSSTLAIASPCLQSKVAHLDFRICTDFALKAPTEEATLFNVFVTLYARILPYVNLQIASYLLKLFYFIMYRFICLTVTNFYFVVICIL